MSNKTNITPGVWRQGKLLDTTRTRNWSTQAKEQANQQESCMVFANFRDEDNGISRIFLASCASPEIAALIAEAGTVTNECGKTPRELLELVRELRDAIIANIENDGICIGHTLASKIDNIKNL